MAAEDLGALFNTKMPGYDDAADIQAALKLFLYGSATYNSENTDPDLLPTPSLAKHLQTLTENISELDDRGVGSVYASEEPTAPTDGFVWVDSDATMPVISSNIFYQATEPTGTIAQGSIWTDSDSTPLTMYVYDSVLGWREVGA